MNTPTSEGKLRVGVTTVFERNLACAETTIVNRGSARSSKSYSIAQLLVMFATSQEHKNILITRKTMPSLKMTAYKLIIDLITEYGYYNKDNHSKTSPFTYKLGTNTFWFVSIYEEPQRIKSTEFNYIWMEEANEFTYTEYNTLKLRLSGKVNPGEKNHIYLSFNPIDAHSWIPMKLLPQKEVVEIHSTYKDNPFVEPSYIPILENLKEEDPNYYKIYALGEYGSAENLIYHKYDFKMLEEGIEPDDVYYGQDFGYNAPAVLLEVARKNGELYLRELLYQSHMTNVDIIDFMKDVPELTDNKQIWADSEDPKTIEEIFQSGFNIIPITKGPGSVARGIDLCQRQKFHIHPDSINLIKEIQAYKWKQDKNNNVLDEPVKFNDHAMDALRYVVSGMFEYEAPQIRSL